MVAIDRYSRHVLLREVGQEGQRRIQEARILIIGAGGLGSPAALYLASSGVKKITVVDEDTVDLSNLQRQIIHNMARLGQPKAVSAKESLLALNPEVDICALVQHVERKNLTELVDQHDIVLDCTDNTASRYVINEVCYKKKKPLISGGVVSFDGQISVFDFRQTKSPCYACLFPNKDGEDEKCAVKGVFAPLVGMIGCMQAAEALKIAGDFAEPIVGKLLMVDARNMQWSSIRVMKDSQCPVCSGVCR